MPLKEELRTQGNWLFKHRSHLPLLALLLIPPALWEINNGDYAFRERLWWQLICLGTALLGVLVRAVAVGSAARGTSGRNTGAQKADSLNTTGLYACVRHPLYVGNYLLFLGVTLVVGVWWFPVIGSLLYWLYYERIMYAEEEFLRDTYGDTYVQWASQTPAFAVAIGRWCTPERPFSLKKVLRSEGTSWLGMVSALALVDTLVVSFRAHALAYTPLWLITFAGGLVVYLALRVARKYTRLLK